MDDGTFGNRKLFAYVNSGAPDGKQDIPFYYWVLMLS